MLKSTTWSSNLVNGQTVNTFGDTLNDCSEHFVVLHGLGDGSVVLLGVDCSIAAHPPNPELLYAV